MKRVLNLAGVLLALVAVFFVYLRFREYSGRLELGRLAGSSWPALGALAALYASLNLLLALAWRDVLRYLGAEPGTGWSIRAYGVSQLAKYVPGNIFHLAGRQAIGLAGGHGGRALARSAAWEVGLAVFSGALFSVLAVPLFVGPVTPALAWTTLLCLAGLAALLAARRFASLVAGAFSMLALFWLLSGLVFSAVTALVASSPLSPGSVTALCGAYAVASLAGLVTPGAPAGAGIREMVLLFLLSGVVPEADILPAVLLGRLVTVGGDLLFFLAAAARPFRKPRAGKIPADRGRCPDA